MNNEDLFEMEDEQDECEDECDAHPAVVTTRSGGYSRANGAAKGTTASKGKTTVSKASARMAKKRAEEDDAEAMSGDEETQKDNFSFF